MLALARLVVLCCVALFLSLPSLAQEEIRSFDVVIEVQKNGDIKVTETIDVNVEGRDIRRGIFRDLPAYFEDLDGKGRLPYRYTVLSVRKDGEREPYSRESNGNAVLIRIGDPDVYLDHRVHTYEIRYLVKNMVRYSESFDEVYWNATGTYWQFPILSASAEVVFPEDARVVDAAAYTGYRGSVGRDYDYSAESTTHTFRTNRALAAREGLTVSIAIEKGVIDPPSLSTFAGDLGHAPHWGQGRPGGVFVDKSRGFGDTARSL